MPSFDAPAAASVPLEPAGVARGGPAPPRWMAAVATAAIVAIVGLVVVSAAGAPSELVTVSQRGFGAWLAGPLHGLLAPLSPRGFSIALIALLALYPLAVLGAHRLGAGPVLLAVAVMNAVLLLGPPLFAGDVFGYIGYARLGVLHHLSPYTHGGVALGSDPVHRYVLFRDVVSPYGPGFTLLSYLSVPLGIAGGLWAFKALAAVAGLACSGLSALAARRAGGSAARAAALIGLNPLVALYAVGGAHNDLLIGALVAAALLALSARRGVLAVVAAVAAVALKASELLLVPFVVLGAPARGRALAAAVAATAAAAAGAAIAFGSSLTGMAGALSEQQDRVSPGSVPARLAELSGADVATVRTVLAVLAVVTVAVALVWAWRRRDQAVLAAGWATFALLVTTAWLTPWYLVWLLPLVAVARDRRLEAATLALTVYIGLTHVRLGA